MITFFQAFLLGVFQGVTELFPISSLGHSVLLSWLFNWKEVLAEQNADGTFFLSLLIAMHVATAIALLIFYRKIWLRIFKGFFRSLSTRKVDTPDSKLAWLLILATIPAGIIGLIFEHQLQNQFSKPLSAMVFLFINGLILLTGDYYVRKTEQESTGELSATSYNVSKKLGWNRALIIGVAQVGALFAGISRSGITMVGGLFSGLNHEDSARFTFLLATPIILGAGILKLPEFFANLDAGVRGQILFGSLVAGVSAYLTVKYLDRYFRDKTLRPFGIYCICASLALIGIGLVRGF